MSVLSYCGVIPGAKFKIARSIGPLSSELLRDPNVTGSGNLVLTNFSKVQHLEVVNRPRRRLLEERTKNLLKDKYFESMCVPGYTGGLTAIDGDGDLPPHCRNTERLILEGVGRRFQIHSVGS